MFQRVNREFALNGMISRRPSPGARRGRWILITLLLCAAGVGGGSAALADSSGQGAGLVGLTRLLPNTVSRLLSVATRLGPLAGGQKLALTLPLALPNQAALNTYVNGEYEPGSPDYRHFLTPAQFGARFGATSSEVGQAESALRSLGLTVTSSGANHLYVTATASVGLVEKLFGTAIDRFRLGGRALLSGRNFFANLSDIHLPAVLSGLVTGVIGLDNSIEAQSQLIRAPRVHGITPASLMHEARPHAGSPVGVDGGATPCLAADAGGYTAPDLATAYDFNGLYAKGFHGEGMSAALVEFDDYHDSNVAGMEKCYGMSTPVTRRLVDGGVGGTPGGGEAEDMSDITTLLEMLPKLAHLYVYEAPISGTGAVQNDGGAELDLYNAFVSDDVAPVLSSSWGNCEQLQSAAYDDLLGSIAEEAAAQGQQIFDAAGDSGAVDCRGYPSPVSGSISVEQEAAIPWITGVGGTDLGVASTIANTTIHDEETWNDNGAGGGGESSVWTMPAWQQAYLTATGDRPAGEVDDCGASGKLPCRMVPDIALNADDAAGGVLNTPGGPVPPQFFPTDVGSPGYSIYCATPTCALLSSLGLPSLPIPSPGGLGDWEPIGGTSLATPLAAAAAVLWDQEAKAAGLSGLGFLNPSLYRVASNAAQYKTAFHDVTTDTNSDQYDSTDCPKGCNPNHLYAADTGYDMASGLGSINATVLGGDLIADAKSVDLTPSHEDMYGYVKGITTTQPVSVTSGYYGSTFTASSSAKWLVVAASGKVPGTLSWHVDPIGLAAGSYTGTITVKGASGGTATLGVSYSVTPAAKLSLSTKSLSFSEPAITSTGATTTATCDATTWNDELKDDGLNSASTDTSAVAPTSLASLGISNSGPAGSVLHYEAFLVTPTSGWLSTDLDPGNAPTGFQTGPGQPLVPTNGTVGAGATDELKLASVANNNALGGYPRLNQGTYTGLVQIRDLADPAVTDTVPVTLVLGSGKGTPTIAPSPGSISVTLAPGASTTESLVLADSSKTCGYAYSLSSGASWATINPYLLSGTVPVPAATAAPTSATDTGSGNGFTPVTISAAGLAPGTYKTNLTVNSQNAVTNPTVIPITLTIPGAAKSKTCPAPGKKITVLQHPHRPIRETKAVLSVNGKVVARFRGHAIKRVRFTRPKASRYRFTIVATLSDGEVVSRTVTYTGCNSSKARVKVLHRARKVRRRER
jgi:hypothetical protein